MKLGINIDHIAVLREARRINDPDPLEALGVLKRTATEQVTIHLREDRRHITDADAASIIKHASIPVNLECSINKEIIDIVSTLKPHRATLVPEKREEVTTEGGLDVIGLEDEIKSAIKKLKENEIDVSLFIDPDENTIRKSAELEADMVELHTGTYANIYAMLNTTLSKTHHTIKELELPRAELKKLLSNSLRELKSSSDLGVRLGMEVAAGHGLNYNNVQEIVKIEAISELNIGQSIIARSVFTGLESAIKDMKSLLQ